MRRDFLLFFGVSGSGKSHLLDQLLYNYNKVIICDPEAELTGEFYTADPVKLFAHIRGNPFYRAVFTSADPGHFAVVCDVIERQRNIMFAVDEIQNLVPRGTKIPAGLWKMIFSGRHAGQSLAIATQRVKNLDVNARSQYTRLYSFRQQEPTDCKWIHEVTRSADALDLPSLPDRSYIYHEAGKPAQLIGTKGVMA